MITIRGEGKNEEYKQKTLKKVVKTIITATSFIANILTITYYDLSLPSS